MALRRRLSRDKGAVHLTTRINGMKWMKKMAFILIALGIVLAIVLLRPGRTGRPAPPPDPYENLTSARVKVCVETLSSATPELESRAGSVTGASTQLGVQAGLEQGASCFEFNANRYDASVGINQVPVWITFSLGLPGETTTRYEFGFNRFTPEASEVRLLKYAPSHYPEDILIPLISRDLATGKFKDPHKIYTPDNDWRLNDFVHSWKLEVSSEPPGPALPNGLISVKLREAPLAAYFPDQKLQLIAEGIQKGTLKPEQLRGLELKDLEKTGDSGVTLIHWAARFGGGVFLDWLHAQKQPLPQPSETQGFPVVMATRLRSPEPLLFFLGQLREHPQPLRPHELAFLIAERPDSAEIFKAVNGLGLLTEPGHGHSLIENLRMKLSYPEPYRTDASKKLYKLLPLAGRAELYPKPGAFTNSLADGVLREWVDQTLLLNLYKRDKNYKDRIEEQTVLLAALEKDLERLIAAGVPLTPSGLCLAAKSSFFGNTGDTLESKEYLAGVWSAVFSSESVYLRFRELSETRRPELTVALTNVAYANNETVKQELTAARQDFIDKKAAGEFPAGSFQFSVSGGRLKISGVKLSNP